MDDGEEKKGEGLTDPRKGFALIPCRERRAFFKTRDMAIKYIALGKVKRTDPHPCGTKCNKKRETRNKKKEKMESKQ